MKKLAFFIAMAAVSVGACVSMEAEGNQEVNAFLQLLTQKADPTLAEYARFAGQGDPSESELRFELEECRARGWQIDSTECVCFERSRWKAENITKSYYLSWVRKRFSTAGGSYRITTIEPRNEGLRYSLVSAEIKSNRFLLFHTTDPMAPPGSVFISQVNGRDLMDYLEEDLPESGEESPRIYKEYECQ